MLSIVILLFQREAAVKQLQWVDGALYSGDDMGKICKVNIASSLTYLCHRFVALLQKSSRNLSNHVDYSGDDMGKICKVYIAPL